MKESIIGNCKINSTLSYEFDAATLNKSKYDCRQTYKFSNDFQRNQQVRIKSRNMIIIFIN